MFVISLSQRFVSPVELVHGSIHPRVVWKILPARLPAKPQLFAKHAEELSSLP
jgi:hypothetical protein